ncbi:M20 family metallopeptidase [Georgenia thermotolerans]|uniref:M20/M25/M40 family metallo-hydrolase n=1 Tax=Georgenia thermotolerans TaxID=527326 RepID=A0A7J5US00_9MICO|nr:M20 family metallopeptidase [Georgenia thermotolerans]KAE8764914.1 M20/M25/M40 family metallo-hydrolase [Georgenia thermotolerans]
MGTTTRTVARSSREQAAAELPLIRRDVVALVEAETSSYDVAALHAGSRHVAALAARLCGAPAEERRHPGGAHGDTLTMTWPGTDAGRVLVLAHYDTVWPTGTLAGWPVTSASDASGRETLTGPGIFDMKAGLVQSLWALRLLQRSGAPTPTVTFLFNGDEEIGSPVSRPLIEAAALDVDAVLVAEPSAGGAVKTGRKGVGFFQVDVVGIEAHAGLDPEAGASAIHAIAEIITQLTRIADLSRGTSINVGLIDGGSGTNVAAGHARAMVDIRVQDPTEQERVDRAFDAVTVSDPRVRVTVGHHWNRPPMFPNEASAPLVAVLRDTARELGYALREAFVGGASDANFVAGLGRPVVCGLGAVGSAPHARTEFIYPDTIPTQVALTAGALARLAHGLPTA